MLNYDIHYFLLLFQGSEDIYFDEGENLILLEGDDGSFTIQALDKVLEWSIQQSCYR